MFKNKKVIIGIIIVAVLFVLYNFFLKPKGQDSQLLVADTGGLAQTQEGREILALLEDLKSVKLDSSFFTSVVFSSLNDFSIPIDPEPTGRENPFSPLGTENYVYVE